MIAAHLLTGAVQRLREAGIDDAPRDARRLLAHALEIAPDRLTLHLHDEIDPARAAAFEALIQRRAGREPVSHLVGGRAFYGRWFHVTADVLDPRPETETLVAEALNAPFARVLDLGTGSGAILLTLLAERAEAQGIGADLSAAALTVAAGNAEALEVAGRCRLIASDWYGAVEGTFDLIVSNPPYIAADEMAGLAPELQHEPRMALTDEADGLDAYRAIAAGALAHLTPGGRLLVEIGWTQGPDVAALFKAAGLVGIAVLPDLDGRDRVVSAKAPV